MSDHPPYAILATQLGTFRIAAHEYERLQGLIASRFQAIEVEQLGGSPLTIAVEDMNAVSMWTADGARAHAEADRAAAEIAGEVDGHEWESS